MALLKALCWALIFIIRILCRLKVHTTPHIPPPPVSDTVYLLLFSHSDLMLYYEEIIKNNSKADIL
jgi:hypothetical protein